MEEILSALISGPLFWTSSSLLIEFQQLLIEAEYDVKNYADKRDGY